MDVVRWEYAELELDGITFSAPQKPQLMQLLGDLVPKGIESSGPHFLHLKQATWGFFSVASILGNWGFELTAIRPVVRDGGTTLSDEAWIFKRPVHTYEYPVVGTLGPTK